MLPFSQPSLNGSKQTNAATVQPLSSSYIILCHWSGGQRSTRYKTKCRCCQEHQISGCHGYVYNITAWSCMDGLALAAESPTGLLIANMHEPISARSSQPKRKHLGNRKWSSCLLLRRDSTFRTMNIYISFRSNGIRNGTKQLRALKKSTSKTRKLCSQGEGSLLDLFY